MILVKTFTIKLIPSSYTLLQTLGVIVRIEGIWGSLHVGRDRKQGRQASVAAVLNDLPGIQARGGRACAGP